MFLEGAQAPGTAIQTTSSILKSLAERDEERLSFGDVVKAMGSRAHGAGLLFFALPETIPIPLPGVSALLAVPIVLIAAHLIAFGEGPGLPERVLRQTLPASAVRKVSDWIGPVLAWIERLSRPRLSIIVQSERSLGVLCLALGLVLGAPIPFGNLAPATGIVLIAFGMLQRDGVLIVLGVVLAFVLGAGLYFAADALVGD